MSEYDDEVIVNTSKEYPNMFIQVTVYKEPYALPHRWHTKRKRKAGDLNTFVADQRSVSRTKTTISDLVICNSFDYFCTFTFDGARHDRYNMAKCQRILTTFFHNARRNHSPDLKYLFVPEYHKDRAIHFHALISNYNGRYKPSKVVHNGRRVYNLTGYRAGFSTAVKIDNIEAVGSYVKKYITKDMPMVYGKRRFLCSNNLVRPIKSKNVLFSTIPPIFKKHVFEDAFCDKFQIPIEVKPQA